MTKSSRREQMEKYTAKYGDVCKQNNHIETNLYEEYGVKRGKGYWQGLPIFLL